MPGDFTSHRGGADEDRIHRVKSVGGAYEGLERLPEPLDSPDHGDALTAPDESYIIVTGWREDGLTTDKGDEP